MYSYPHVIENGQGEVLTFLGVVRGPGGDRMQVEGRARPGAGPPMHTHFQQIEVLTVVEGRAGYQRPGSEPRFAGPGESVTFAKGEPHRWWNAGETELYMTGYIEPPLNFEYFLTSLFDSMRRSGRKGPDPFDGAFLVTRYASEFGMLEIPPFVQKFIFPIVRLLGGLLGKYKRYADAPPPA